MVTQINTLKTCLFVEMLDAFSFSHHLVTVVHVKMKNRVSAVCVHVILIQGLVSVGLPYKGLYIIYYKEGTT